MAVSSHRIRVWSPFAGFAIGVALLALGAAGSHATEVRPQTAQQLLESSQQVVVGRVVAQHSYWDAAHRRIFTDVKVLVSNTIKGAVADTLTLTQLGGEVDGARYGFEGAPAFKADDEALLFVWRDHKGRAQVNGLAQGKFTITRAAGSGQRVLDRPLPGLSLRAPTTSTSARRAAEPGHVLLDDAIGALRTLAASATPAAASH